jgi:Mn-dependent DtxR family transcriptional regulator
MSECGCVKVTPVRLKVVVGLGSVKGGVATAEKLEQMLDVPIDEVVDALDGLITAGVVYDVDAQEFYLTEHGSALFEGIYEATGSVADFVQE